MDLHTAKFDKVKTPFYYYDTDLLRQTLSYLKHELSKYKNYKMHYAMKANFNKKLLNIIKDYEFGLDCVSGWEIEAGIKAGFDPKNFVFAGVGKTDDEIDCAIENNIFCFNVESLQEIEIIQQIAEKKEKTARIAIRVNPNINAHTHAHIQTGLSENKFGIPLRDLDTAISLVRSSKNLEFIGLHFHIGSQILDLTDFRNLSNFVEKLLETYKNKGVTIKNINVGGGLGVDYSNQNKFPDFDIYFKVFANISPLVDAVHFELGRSIINQCGNLITRLLYTKQGETRNFAIVDGGMTELIRPALYGAQYIIENISRNEPEQVFDVVGPVCESTDVIKRDVKLTGAKRGDFIVIRCAGAYGESMASNYLCRNLPKGYITEDFN